MRRCLFMILLWCASSVGSAQNDRPTAFIGVNVVPIDAPGVLADQTVVIRDGRITALGAAAAVKIPAGARRVDGRGRYLMPGLSDMHAHLSGYVTEAGADRDGIARSEMLLYVATGVTLIRNMSGSAAHLDYKRRVANKELLGPRIFTATNVLDGPNAVWDFSTKVGDPKEVDALVESFARDGYDQIKVYNELPRAVYSAILDAAARKKIPVVGHIPFSVGIDSGLAAGQYSIEHTRGYDYDGVRPQALILDGGRNAERFSSFSRMSEERMRDLVRKTVAAGTWNTPTFVIDDMLGDSARRNAITQNPLIRYVRPEVVSYIASNVLDQVFNPESKAALGQSFPARYKFVKMLSDAGAGLLIGTDTVVPYLVPGYTPIDEMQHFVKAGLTPYRTLQAATLDAARFLGVAAESGSVTVGKRADLILLDANPLESIDNLWRQNGVVLAGRWLPRKELMAMLDATAATYPKPKAAAK